MLSPHYYTGLIEAGVDEAGRGCLAGPVAAAAVILPDGYRNPRLNDSKQLTARQRLSLREEIHRDAVAWAVGWATVEEIDRLNILAAAILAMHRAIDALHVRPQALIIDGNRFKPYHTLPHTCHIKGDARFMAIAAASILAKTARDELMEQLATEWPGYGWEQNKGYPTRAHRDALRRLGPTPHHRRSFQLLPPEQPTLPFA